MDRRGQRETKSRRKSCPMTNPKIAPWQAVFRTIDESGYILEISFGIRNGIGRSKWILQRLVTINRLLLWSRLWRQKSRIWQSKGVVRALSLIHISEPTRPY